MTLAHTNIRTIDVARTVDFYRLVGLKLIGCMNLGALTTLYLGDEESEHLLEITIQAEPDPAWPAAPKGWRFWLNRNGRRSSGPIGAYGAVDAGRLELATVDPGLLLMHS